MSAYCLSTRLGSPLALSLAIVVYGCAATPDSSTAPPGHSPAPPAPVRPTTTDANRPPGVAEPAATYVDARPAALVNGRTVTWGNLRPALNELAGADALQEFILDQRLRELADQQRIVITDADEAAEQRLLVDTLSDDPNTAIRLLDELRDRQKLGKHRFKSLLRRNAMLRALVRDRVHVTENAVDRMFDAVHGPKRQARILTVPDLASARTAIDRIVAGTLFGDVAVEISTDSSAPRGGLLQPFSRLDPSYPAAIRDAVWGLGAPGDISDPVLLDSGYAVLQLVREIDGSNLSPGDEAYIQQRDRIRRLVELNQQRLLMDQLARRILADLSVTIFDDALNDSWQRARRLQRP